MAEAGVLAETQREFLDRNLAGVSGECKTSCAAFR